VLCALSDSQPQQDTDRSSPFLPQTLVRSEVSLRRQAWLYCLLTRMASKTLKGTAQPIRLTDPEDVFCKAIGLDTGYYNDGLLLGQVKVRVAIGEISISATSVNELTRQYAFKAGMDSVQIASHCCRRCSMTFRSVRTSPRHRSVSPLCRRNAKKSSPPRQGAPGPFLRWASRLRMTVM